MSCVWMVLYMARQHILSVDQTHDATFDTPCRIPSLTIMQLEKPHVDAFCFVGWLAGGAHA